MEFFAIADVSVPVERLHARLTVPVLPECCPVSIERLIAVQDDDRGRVWTVWGEFDVRREHIADGLRFTLPGCHNAVAWTITTCTTTATGHPPAPESVVVHVTINRTEQDADFVETLECFADEWRQSLERTFGNRTD